MSDNIYSRMLFLNRIEILQTYVMIYIPNFLFLSIREIINGVYFE